MILRSSPASPFGRKVKIALAVLGLKDKVEVVVADTNDAADVLRQQNPLGKIPVLVLDDGKSIFDSRVIVEYLDQLAGGGKMIPAGPARIDVLVQHALADGLMDAALLQVLEGRWRAEDRREAKWLAYQAEKIQRVLKVWALGYLDLRFEGKWRADHPKMVKWLDAFAAQNPSFEETRFKG
jgi:glutathione S-transferase